MIPSGLCDNGTMIKSGRDEEAGTPRRIKEGEER